MKKKNHLYRTIVALFLMAAMLVSSPRGIVRAEENSEKVSVSLIGKYDSADTAAIRDIDIIKKLIRFRNHSTGKTYTLSYDNTSMMYDSRGTVLSPSLLSVGQIVDVTFLKSAKHITTLNVSKDAWVVENTRDHELVRQDGTARVKGDTYKIDARTLVMADGDLALAEDVLSTDTVTVSGMGKEIYSVVVTSGHGYVSLSSDTVEDHSLVGAWIELDNEVIHKISPNMLLSAPEGDYNLQILGNGASYQSEVNISRNQETVVDTSNVNIARPKEGLVTFEITPEDAEVFVDGERMLTGTSQSIRYGYHSLKVIADGYITQDKYLKIGTPKSVIRIELEKEEDSSDAASTADSSAATGSTSGSSTDGISTGSYYGEGSSVASTVASTAATVSSNSSSDKKKSSNEVIYGYKLYFDKPYNAEVYFDGAYVGMIPTSVTKISGSHEVILKRDGYETKSYRVSVDSDEVDLNYTFPDLVKIEDENSSSSSSASSASSEASSASSEASTASSEASTASSEASTESSEASTSSSEASTASSEASTGATGSGADASTQGDTSAQGTSTGAEGSSGASAGETTTDTGSTKQSEGEGGGTPSTTESSTETPPTSNATEGVSTGSTENTQKASDAASTASGGNP